MRCVWCVMNEMGHHEVYLVRSTPWRAFFDSEYIAAADGGAKPPPRFSCRITSTSLRFVKSAS